MKPIIEWTPEEVLSNPTASKWLKNALREALKRDPVDAANDSQALSVVLLGNMRRKLAEPRKQR